MTSVSTRRAVPADAEALAALGRRTFSDKFGAMYPPADLAAFLAKAYSAEKFARDLANPAQAAWVAERDGEAVGYATAGPCGLPHPDVTADCGELYKLYVRQDAQGSGLGARLMETVLDWLGERFPGRHWLGVWSENFGAQRFYHRYGFGKVGEYVFQVGETGDHEFIFRRG